MEGGKLRAKKNGIGKTFLACSAQGEGGTGLDRLGAPSHGWDLPEAQF